MDKLFKNIVLFGIILSICFILIESLLSRNIKDHISYKYEEIYEPKENANIVILGTSHAAHGINPRYLNIKEHNAYNFAFNGCTPQYYLKWYTQIFRENYPKPEYLIYAVDWAMFDSTWAERTFDIDIRHADIRVFLNTLLNDADISKKQLIFNEINLLYHHKKLQYLFYKKTDFEYLNLKAYYNGYVPNISTSVKMGKSPEYIPSSERWKKDFNCMLDRIERDSIKIIFVNIPEYIPSWNTKNIQQCMQYLDSLALSRNIPYLRYNTELKSEYNYDSTNFNNWFHLNDKGATLFSKTLSRDLNKCINNGI